MVLKTFSIYDTKAEAYLPPFFCSTAGVAIRNFEAAANDQGHQFHKHASDYCLFELGTFDDQTGQLEMLKAPISLGLAMTFIKYIPPGTDVETRADSPLPFLPQSNTKETN